MLCDRHFEPGEIQSVEMEADCQACLRRLADPGRVSSALFEGGRGGALLELSLQQAREHRPNLAEPSKPRPGRTSSDRLRTSPSSRPSARAATFRPSRHHPRSPSRAHRPPRRWPPNYSVGSTGHPKVSSSGSGATASVPGLSAAAAIGYGWSQVMSRSTFRRTPEETSPEGRPSRVVNRGRREASRHRPRCGGGRGPDARGCERARVTRPSASRSPGASADAHRRGRSEAGGGGAPGARAR